MFLGVRLCVILSNITRMLNLHCFLSCIDVILQNKFNQSINQYALIVDDTLRTRLVQVATDQLLALLYCLFRSAVRMQRGESGQNPNVSNHKSNFSLLCGPISPLVNLDMSSTARFCVEMQYMGAQD